MKPLAGRRILVIEDEAIIAMMVEDMLTELGATVVGPASSIKRGLLLADSCILDAAVLDVNIRSERVDPVADVLRERRVPIVFATGYGGHASEAAADTRVIEKPYTLEKLEHALTTVLVRRSEVETATRLQVAEESPASDIPRGLQDRKRDQPVRSQNT
jgi:two-component SAPR family response regulator